MTYNKIPSLCLFTIHSIKLGVVCHDPFQVEWKRGDTHGMTERSFPDHDGIASFEKSGRVNITIYSEKKTGAIRSKQLKFRFIVWRKNQCRTFGKAEVDISVYFRTEIATTTTIEVESPHSQQSHAVITFAITSQKNANGELIIPEDDMTSVADAMP
jgi:hypothetical protein